MLTDTKVRNEKPRDKPFKLADSGGLHLYVTPSGGKLWRYKYVIDDKEKLLSIGPYPAISLSDARKARDDAKAMLREHRDPGVEKKLKKIAGGASNANTFETIAREWYELSKSQWVDRHSADVIGSLEKDVFPLVGNVPIKDLEAPAVLSVLRLIEKRPAIETAHRVRQRMSAIFVYAIASGRGKDDPAAVVQKALAPIKKGRQPAIIDLNAARAMLQKADDEAAHPVTKLAIRILALTYVRPGTLAGTPWSEWADIDAENPQWRVPAERLKLKKKHKDDEARDHIVTLPRQAVEAIEVLRTISGRGPLAFPNARHAHKPMSENAMSFLLKRAGFLGKHVPHGWRSTFSSVMNELHPADKPIIDLMLSHMPDNKVEAAYNRARHLARRRELAQVWADLILEGAKPASELIDGPRR
jgi:integrase